MYVCGVEGMRYSEEMKYAITDDNSVDFLSLTMRADLLDGVLRREVV